MSPNDVIQSLLEHSRAGKRVLGIGPMSTNCVEAIFRFSHSKHWPIELIASRRQIECHAFGGGYVNGWTTETFSEHAMRLRQKYPNSRVLLCRDHGGPWQGYHEEKMPFEEAMKRARTSYEADIAAGFDLLHIDPSVNGDGKLTLPRVLAASLELIAHCSEFAKTLGRSIAFEAGTEENVGAATSNEVFETTLSQLTDGCASAGLPKPLFVVGQTGSLVKEMRQVGNFDIEQARTLSKTAARYGASLKEHNGDYLSPYQLRQRQLAGVPALNVAPEFGVMESKAMAEQAMAMGKPEQVEKFLQVSIQSGKWKKWLVDARQVSEYDKGMMAGHYVFSEAPVAAIRKELGGEKFDEMVIERLEKRIGFYCGEKTGE